MRERRQENMVGVWTEATAVGTERTLTDWRDKSEEELTRSMTN